MRKSEARDLYIVEGSGRADSTAFGAVVDPLRGELRVPLDVALALETAHITTAAGFVSLARTADAYLCKELNLTAVEVAGHLAELVTLLQGHVAPELLAVSELHERGYGLTLARRSAALEWYCVALALLVILASWLYAWTH